MADKPNEHLGKVSGVVGVGSAVYTAGAIGSSVSGMSAAGMTSALASAGAGAGMAAGIAAVAAAPVTVGIAAATVTYAVASGINSTISSMKNDKKSKMSVKTINSSDLVMFKVPVADKKIETSIQSRHPAFAKNSID